LIFRAWLEKVGQDDSAGEVYVRLKLKLIKEALARLLGAK